MVLLHQFQVYDALRSHLITGNEFRLIGIRIDIIFSTNRFGSCSISGV